MVNMFDVIQFEEVQDQNFQLNKDHLLLNLLQYQMKVMELLLETIRIDEDIEKRNCHRLLKLMKILHQLTVHLL